MIDLAATATPVTFAMHATRSHRRPYRAPPHILLANRVICETIWKGNGRLLIMWPPRHGKSWLVSRFLPAWFLGCYPDRRVILTSYEAGFAAKWGGQVRDLLAEHGGVFGGVTPSIGSRARNTWVIDRHEGGMETAGVGGAITGKGADLLIIDDPVKNAQQAHSATYQDRSWEWWQSTASTRLEPGATVIVMATRWHERDLLGRLEAGDDGEPWTVIRIPAIAEENDPLGRELGEALWPDRYSDQRLAEIRRRVGDYWWSALYQQRPSPAEGGVFKRSDLRYYRRVGDWIIEREGETVNIRTLTRFITVDLAASERTSADWTVAAVWGTDNESRLYLLDIIRLRTSTDHERVLAESYSKWSPSWVGIESVAFQLTLVQNMSRKGYPIRELKADRDKLSRALVAQARYSQHAVFHPFHADWLGEYEDELLAFPNGAHDDQVDTAGYAALALAEQASAAWQEAYARQLAAIGDSS